MCAAFAGWQLNPTRLDKWQHRIQVPVRAGELQWGRRHKFLPLLKELGRIFLSGGRDRVIVEACWGLGDALVSGKVTPDRFVLDRNDNTIYRGTLPPVDMSERGAADKTRGCYEAGLAKDPKLSGTLKVKFSVSTKGALLGTEALKDSTLKDADVTKCLLDVVKHEVRIQADRFTPVNATLIPTGELKPVQGTPFDFRTPTDIGARINQEDEQLKFGKGYDHNWVINKQLGQLTLMARVAEPTTGRVMEVSASADELAEVVRRLPPIKRDIIHPGELESIAVLLREEDLIFCSCDAATIQILPVFDLAERGISAEALLRQSGLLKPGLQERHTEDYFRNNQNAPYCTFVIKPKLKKRSR